MKRMLWNQDGLTWEIAKYDGATWPMWSVTNDDGKFFMSESLYDCILWAELETGKKISMLDVFSG